MKEEIQNLKMRFTEGGITSRKEEKLRDGERDGRAREIRDRRVSISYHMGQEEKGRTYGGKK